MTISATDEPVSHSNGSSTSTGMNGASTQHENSRPPGDSSSGPWSSTIAIDQSSGLAQAVDEVLMKSAAKLSERSSELKGGAAPKYHFTTTKEELSDLANERTRAALADALEKALKRNVGGGGGGGVIITQGNQGIHDEESPTGGVDVVTTDVLKLVARIRELETSHPCGESEDDYAPEQIEADKNAEVAANAFSSILLYSHPESGINSDEVEHRREVFGSNHVADKQPESFLKLCWEAVKDFVLVMLIVLGVTSIIAETVRLEDGEKCGVCWLEGAAILVSVCIVVGVTAGIDYAKQFAFIRLTRSLLDTNTKSVVRDGKQTSVVDDDIVVGDILSVNSHNLASIPADCIMLGPATDLRMDESSLTGESLLVPKKPGDIILSGTTAKQGSGKMVVIAVGVYSVAGKIQRGVYGSKDDNDGGDLGDEDETSPLAAKLDLIAKQIGLVGTVAAVMAFAASCIIGLGFQGESLDSIIDYLMLAITVLAVAVPEGLPLAVTLALAFSSEKMMKDQNLVKHLDACETMGSATTICTDKTGTLTANKMTARALFMGLKSYLCEDPNMKLADFVRQQGVSESTVELLCRLISIDTMNETVLYFDKNGNVEGQNGNPTEVALLRLVHDFGTSYEQIRNSTPGRSTQRDLAEFFSNGKQYDFSSARKLMSWAIPLEDGGFRLFCKGAQEVVLARCSSVWAEDGTPVASTDETVAMFREKALYFSRRGMRCLGLAYRDLPAGFDLESLSSSIVNSDGTPAFESETELTAIALVGIEDPLRPEVPTAIAKCYGAGIDVRLVTGDNTNTAASIAYQAGILRDEHFMDESGDKVASNLKPNVLMEGRDFRSQVYTTNGEGQKEFDQTAFDTIWPHLRVLSRSSPDDKLTLAHGLNRSELYADEDVCQKLRREDNIVIFPDRQVVAMTGDGTNDAPALRRSDIGFAMGISGTQIAKDAADIILLDDNFASIVTAAKWGRNIYASIQKFLQFQLTVNISAVVTALVGAFRYQTSPLAAIQLLWVNLLMDSLASLALASEPPVDFLLMRPPVNRTQHMVSPRMRVNMIGQSLYQIAVVMVLLFEGPELLGVEPGHIVEDRKENSVHYTIIFNSFVWMQLFNEINCRNLRGEFNVFRGIQNNPIFCGILIVTAGLQVLLVEVGDVAFHVAKGGLKAEFWGLSLALGAGSLPVQQVINVFYNFVLGKGS